MTQTDLLTTADSRTLASTLAPVIREACEGRLGEISWFRADWQRGGAATGKSTFAVNGGKPVQALIKVPVVQRELVWMKRLQQHADGEPVVPRLFAGNDVIGGYDLAWIVIEWLPHGPLALHWHNDHIRRTAEAAAQFHAAVADVPVDRVPTSEPWEEIFADAAESIRVNHIANEQRWLTAMKSLRQRAGSLIDEWNTRPEDQWLHGDLHLANAMSRTSRDEGPVVLIDLAEVHAGHWIEDAIYLERQLWARPEWLKDTRPVKAVATARKSLGLSVGDEYPRLAMIRRAFLAASAPKFIKTEGHPAYLAACLDWLEIALQELK